MANKQQHTDEQINEFLALAEEMGITRAMRELGYPKSWATAKRWADMRGAVVAVDAVMAKAAATREWYKTEEIITVAQAGIARVFESNEEGVVLSPDDQKKLAEALNKYYIVWANAQGKATNITESRETDGFNEHLQELLNVERAKKLLNKENVTE